MLKCQRIMLLPAKEKRKETKKLNEDIGFIKGVGERGQRQELRDR